MLKQNASFVSFHRELEMSNISFGFKNSLNNIFLQNVFPFENVFFFSSFPHALTSPQMTHTSESNGKTDVTHVRHYLAHLMTLL